MQNLLLFTEGSVTNVADQIYISQEIMQLSRLPL